jgi:hypothetical protein
VQSNVTLHCTPAAGCLAGQPLPESEDEPPEPVVPPPVADPEAPLVLPAAPLLVADPAVPAEVVLEVSSPPQLPAATMAPMTDDPTSANEAIFIEILPCELLETKGYKRLSGSK